MGERLGGKEGRRRFGDEGMLREGFPLAQGYHTGRPTARQKLRALNRANLRVVVVTNQSGVARGLFTETMVEAIHREIEGILEAGGAHVDAYYYCPHHPDASVEAYRGPCGCRKPARGLVDRAVDALGVDPTQSFVVGDRWLDIALAREVGARGVLVRTGYGRVEETARRAEPLAAEVIVDNLAGAAAWILRVQQETSMPGRASSARC